MNRLKKGDTVVVTTGKDKGRSGTITQMLPKKDRAFVQGVNMVKRHTRQSQTEQGGIVSKEASIHLSNLMLADPKDGKPTRVKIEERDGKRVRVAKRSGEVVDG